MNFVEELKWRGMLHDMMPGTGSAAKIPQSARRPLLLRYDYKCIRQAYNL